MQLRSDESGLDHKVGLAWELVHAINGLSQSEAAALLPVAESIVLRAPARECVRKQRLGGVADKVDEKAGVGTAAPASSLAKRPSQKSAFMVPKMRKLRLRALALSRRAKAFLKRFPDRGETMRWLIVGLQLALWLVASSLYHRVMSGSRVPFGSAVVVVSRADTENGGALPINTALALGRSVQWIPSGLHRATSRQLWAAFNVRVRPVLRVHIALAKGARTGIRLADIHLSRVSHAQRSIVSAPPKSIRRAALVITEGEWLAEFSACAPLWMESGAKMVLFQRVAWNEDAFVASSVCGSAVALDDYNRRILEQRKPRHTTVHILGAPVLAISNLRFQWRNIRLLSARRAGRWANSQHRILLVALQPVEPFMNRMLEFVLQFSDQLNQIGWVVRVRLHPSQRDFDTRGFEKSRASLASDLFESDALVTGVSNAAFSAAEFGVPVLSFRGDEFEPASFVRSLPIDAFLNEESDLVSILSALPRKPAVGGRSQASELLLKWRYALEEVGVS